MVEEPDIDDVLGGEAPEEAPAKGPKTVYLKQFLVSGSENLSDGSIPRTCAWILASCAKKARDEFKERFGMKVLSCSQWAETETPAKDAAGRDFWAEGDNRVFLAKPPEPSEYARKYFALKVKGEKVQAAKKKAGIGRWDLATPEQRRAFDAEFARLGG